MTPASDKVDFENESTVWESRVFARASTCGWQYYVCTPGRVRGSAAEPVDLF